MCDISNTLKQLCIKYIVYCKEKLYYERCIQNKSIYDTNDSTIDTLNTFLFKYCNHTWETDWIETNSLQMNMIPIEYCIYCGYTK